MDNFITKERSLCIKGVAIILMLIHHCFGFPEWYYISIKYVELDIVLYGIKFTTKICVAIFAFITGWGFAYTSNKSIYSSIKRIKNLLMKYWFVMMLILLLAIITGFRYQDKYVFLLELFGLYTPIMIFGWYVYFYILSMLFLPLVYHFFNDLKLTLIIAFISLLISEKIYLIIHNNILRDVIAHFLFYFPIIVLGYLMAYHNLYSKIFEKNLNYQKI